MAVWLEKVSATRYCVYQRPALGSAGEFVRWNWERYDATCWDLYASEFCRFGAYTTKRVVDNAAWTYHNPTGGGAWATNGSGFKQFAPPAGYDADADPAYAEVAIPDGTKSVVLDFEFRLNITGVALIRIDGSTALVNGRDLTAAGEVDHYGTDRTRVLELAHDLPAGAHTLRITVKSLNSHGAGQDDVCIGTVYFVTGPADPDGATATTVRYSQRHVQAESTSDLCAVQSGGTWYGGSAHGNETFVSLAVTLDGNDRTGDANGTVTEGAVAVCATQATWADLASVVKTLTFAGHALKTEIAITWAKGATLSAAYLAMLSVGNLYGQPQWYRQFWTGGAADWGTAASQVALGTTSSPGSAQAHGRVRLPDASARLALDSEIVAWSGVAQSPSSFNGYKFYWSAPENSAVLANDVWACTRYVLASAGNLAGPGLALGSASLRLQTDLLLVGLAADLGRAAIFAEADLLISGAGARSVENEAADIFSNGAGKVFTVSNMPAALGLRTWCGCTDGGGNGAGAAVFHPFAPGGAATKGAA